jgi:hypothetical protein
MQSVGVVNKKSKIALNITGGDGHRRQSPNASIA